MDCDCCAVVACSKATACCKSGTNASVPFTSMVSVLLIEFCSIRPAALKVMEPAWVLIEAAGAGLPLTAGLHMSTTNRNAHCALWRETSHLVWIKFRPSSGAILKKVFTVCMLCSRILESSVTMASRSLTEVRYGKSQRPTGHPTQVLVARVMSSGTLAEGLSLALNFHDHD